jgi:hypothetical protein
MPSLAREALQKHGPLAAVLVILMTAFTTVTMTIITKQGDKIEALSTKVNDLAEKVASIDKGQDFVSRMIDSSCEPKEKDRPAEERARANR